MKRKQLLFLLCDIVLIQISLFLSFILRFEGTLPENFMTLYAPLVIPLTIFKIGSFLLVNLYNKAWRYANIDELISLLQGVFLSSVTFAGYAFFFRVAFPRSIILIEFMITVMLLGGTRFILRLWNEYRFRSTSRQNAVKVLIVGAGDAGEMVVKEYLKHKDLNIQIVGFIDDDTKKHGMEIHGIKVLGVRENIPEVIEYHQVKEIIIAIPSASGKVIREIHKYCSKPNITVRILPGMYELINGTVSLNQIREVQVDDLLGREPARINIAEVVGYLTGKTILITGGGGSIGSELCRQVAKFEPAQLVIFDISENNIYDIDLELRDKFPNLKVIPIVGSIRDVHRLHAIFETYKPHVVFHAAAHKHVPLMEFNAEEAVKNNIFGTKNVAQVSHEHGVERFVMISTDKAVNPTNIMGATKRVAEMIIQDYNTKSRTKFVAVRFGNVLGSRGSVIPLFKSQIMQGGPVTVTHPDITRYFMTIPEASQLVIQAAALGQGGEVFVLDMGKPVKIVDLAKDLIELSGLRVGEDIEIKITGLRPGEKLYEELLSDKENTLATQHERILVAKLDEIDGAFLNQCLTQFDQLLGQSKPQYLVGVLVKLVATFCPDHTHHEVDNNDVQAM